MHLDFDISNVNWKEIGKALLSITGTGFLTIMVFAVVTITDGSYQPTSTSPTYTVSSVAFMTAAVMAIGAFVQLTIFVWCLPAWLQSDCSDCPLTSETD